MEEIVSKKRLASWQMITAIIISVVVVLAVVMVLWPKFQELQFSQDSLEGKKAEIQVKEKYFSSLAEARSSLEERKEEIKKIESALPEDPSIPSLFLYLQKVTSNSGLIFEGVSSFSVNESKELNGEIKEIIVNMEATGSYESLKDLIYNLENSAKIMEVENISFSSDKITEEITEEEVAQAESEEKGGRNFSFKIKIVTYSY